MTIAEMENMTEDFLTVKQVATCLHCDPQLVRDQAEREVRFLGFPISRIGHSIKIPRLGFLAWAKGEQLKSQQMHEQMIVLLKSICDKELKA